MQSLFTSTTVVVDAYKVFSNFGWMLSNLGWMPIIVQNTYYGNFHFDICDMNVSLLLCE